jgi:hypothetical protein
VKPKIEKKPPEELVKSEPMQVIQSQPQILTILQQQPQQQLKVKSESSPQQIILSMSQAQAMLQQAQQPKGAVYTFPTNLILNNGAFMTNSGEVVGNFKFENQ